MHYVKPHFKRILHIVGGGLGAAGVLFVAVRLHQYAGQIAADRFSPIEWFFIALLAFIYGGANVLLAMAWLNLILSSVLLGMGFQTFMVAFLADLLAANRKLAEDMRLELKSRKGI